MTGKSVLKISYLLLCLSLTVSCFSALRAYGAENSNQVVVGYFENEIFQMGAREGAVKTGYAYEYYRKLSEYTGWRYKYVYGDFSDLYQMLLDGDIDLLAGLAMTEERTGIIGYPDMAMGSETYNIIKHTDDDSITSSYSTLNHKSIGVLDSAMVGVLKGFLNDHEIDADVRVYPDYQQILNDFDNDLIDAMVGESDGIQDRENASLLYAFGYSDYYLCVSKSRPDLLDELNAAQQELVAEEPNYINSLQIKYYSSSISSRTLSAGEREWLENNDTLRVGYLNHYLPYSDTDKNGEVNGLVKDYIPKILKELEISDKKVTYVGYDSYDEMVADLGKEKIDTAFPVGGGLYFSEEVGIYQSNAVVTSVTELVYYGSDSDGIVSDIAVNENNRMQYYYVLRNFPDAEIKFYPSIESCLDAVLNGEVECTTLNGIRAYDILKNRKYRSLSLHQLSHDDERCFGIRIGNEGLLKLINRGVNIIGDGQAENMAYKYASALYRYSVPDMLLDNLWFITLIVIVIAAMAVFFVAREAAAAKRRMREKEEAGRELEEKNRQLAEAVKDAEQANKAKSDFLSSMSHDIRTPMNSILSMNEMILRECENENILIYSGHIRSSGNMLLSLINDILDFSKIEAGKLDIIPVDYELSSVLNDLVNMAHTKADEKGLILDLKVDPSLPNYLKGDEVRIKQVITNILTNAIKYTMQGMVTFRMGFEKLPEDSSAVLLKVEVEDTGVGIRQEDIDRMFEAFERLDEKSTRNIEGTGLGITITQRLLNLMGSSLNVSSEYGKGSLFSFTLKQSVLRWDEVGDFETAFKRSVAESKKYREKFTAPDAHILVVDDTPVNLTVITSLLKNTKLNIDTAESANACIESASKKKYDIIFLDHMMPQKDGIQALRELRSIKDNPNLNTPVICLTANAISGMRETYLAAGFDDYLTKPIDPDSLEDAIIRYLPDEKVMLSEDTGDDEEEDTALPEELYEIKGISVEAGLRHCINASSYTDSLITFCRTCETGASEIERLWKERDIPGVTVKVHGLKSSAGVIGAEELSKKALMLEDAGEINNVELLEKEMDGLIKQYRELGSALLLLFPDDTKDLEKTSVSSKELEDIYQSLKKHSEEFDYDSMEAAGELLLKCDVPDAEKSRVEKIIKALSELDYDEIPKILSE